MTCGGPEVRVLPGSRCFSAARVGGPRKTLTGSQLGQVARIPAVLPLGWAWAFSSTGRAPVSHTGGWRFESVRAYDRKLSRRSARLHLPCTGWHTWGHVCPLLQSGPTAGSSGHLRVCLGCGLPGRHTRQVTEPSTADLGRPRKAPVAREGERRKHAGTGSTPVRGTC